MKSSLSTSTLLVIATVSAALSTPARAAELDLARIGREVSAVKAWIPAGSELAGAYTRDFDPATSESKIQVKTDRDYLVAVSRSYLQADLNHDGREDLVLAIEAAPRTSPDSFMEFGDRALLIFLADAQGQLVLSTESKTLVMKADEGGLLGDPFAGLSINAKGTLSIENSGGSKDRWGFIQRFQYRNGDFFLIGSTKSSYDTNSGSGTTLDRNLLTGDQIETRTRSDRPDHLVRKKTPIQPLRKLTETSVE